MAIVEIVKPPRTDDPKEIDKFFRAVANHFSYIDGAANPVTSGVTPRWYGDYYFEIAAGDWWRSTGITSATWEQITFASGTVGDHGSLTGLGDDDHSQYLKDKANGGTAAEIPAHTHASSAEAGTIDHGALTGRADNDHEQYQAQSFFFARML